MARLASRLAERNDLSVPRGAAPRMGARYDADAFGRFSEANVQSTEVGHFVGSQLAALLFQPPGFFLVVPM